MKNLLVLILFYGGLVSPAWAAAPSCDITVSFGSYAMGIDHQALDHINSYAKASKDIAQMKLIPWGKEGEKNLCLKVKPEKLQAVYQQIKSMIPKESKAAWIEIRQKGKKPFRTRWPK